MTFEELRAEGVRHLEQLNGGTWTDYNGHDPGITLLEALCYTLTDLAYRTGHDVQDLLADRGSDPYASLHRAADILTTRAVTPDDLRRLVLDVPGVKNAWIEPVEERLQDDTPLAGLYRVAIEPSPEREGLHVVRDTGKLLHKHRGLCEDFTEVLILEPLPICVDAKVEIGRVDDPAVTYARILDAVSEVLSPTVPFATPAERLASGLPIDKVFDGPLLEHGFITGEALAGARRRAALHASDVVHAVMDVPGVRAVTEVLLRSGDARAPWSLDLPADRAPRLDRAGSAIQLRSAGLPVAIGAPPPAAPFPPRVQMGASAGIVPPPSRDRNVSVYRSAMRHLPMIYGVGEAGLPDSAPPERKAAARQLQAYLMLFDQLMANHLAQLARVKDLFSIRVPSGGASVRTYHAQVVREPELGLDAVAKAAQADLDSMVEDEPLRLARKHRFLNHLLARFAEDLNDRYAAAGAEAPGASGKLLRQKQEFLTNYPRISGSRGVAFDGLGAWGKQNPSGLEDRVRYKLGLFEEDGETMAVIEHILLRDSQLHRFDWFLSRYLPAVADPYSLRLTFVFPGEAGRFGAAGTGGDYPFRRIVEQTVRAQAPAHLRTHVLWLTAAEWRDFHEAHIEWRRVRREHLCSKLGLSLGLEKALRATIPGLSPVPGAIQTMYVAPWGATAAVNVFGSQEGGATYSLVKEPELAITGQEPELLSSSAVIGTGKTIEIESDPLGEDLVIRVQVERRFDDTIWLNAALPVKVRANPGLVVKAAAPEPAAGSQSATEPSVVVLESGAGLVVPGAAVDVAVQASQASVTYSAYTRPLLDEDFYVTGLGTVAVTIPRVQRLPAPPEVRVAKPSDEVWNQGGYTLAGGPTKGHGGALPLPAGTITRDTIVVIRAHKDHEYVDHGDRDLEKTFTTDVQLQKVIVLLARPGPAARLTLKEVTVPMSGAEPGDVLVEVTDGEPGVLYYLLHPGTGAQLGKPAYFHRVEGSPAKNRGIGKMRVARDLAVARGTITADKDRAVEAPLNPVIVLNQALPANRTLNVMAVRARTGVAWSAARALQVQPA